MKNKIRKNITNRCLIDIFAFIFPRVIQNTGIGCLEGGPNLDIYADKRRRSAEALATIVHYEKVEATASVSNNHTSGYK